MLDLYTQKTWIKNSKNNSKMAKFYSKFVQMLFNICFEICFKVEKFDPEPLFFCFDYNLTKTPKVWDLPSGQISNRNPDLPKFVVFINFRSDR